MLLPSGFCFLPSALKNMSAMAARPTTAFCIARSPLRRRLAPVMVVTIGTLFRTAIERILPSSVVRALFSSAC